MQEKLDDLRSRVEQLRQGGGPKRIARQHAAGKLTARERLSLLFDPGTFTEIDLFVEGRGTEFGLSNTPAAADGVVTGYGQIHGRTVFAFSQDFTVLGGSLGEMHAEKIVKVQELALKAGCPLIGINDSGGARIQEGIDALNGYGRIFFRNTQASGVIPQLSVIMGPCAGGAVYSPGLTDFIFMVEQTSYMFITGPQVIKTVTGEEVSQEELGGARTHATKSGLAHFTAPSEAQCFEQIRELLTYLPQNNLDDPPQAPAAEPAATDLASLVPVDPNRPYDVKQVITAIVDQHSFFEVQAQYATNMVVGFARLGGRPVGVVANQPRVLAGCIDIDASDKAARFIRFCDAFNIPLVTFVDTPGYLPGTGQEYGGIIRHGAKLLYAYSEATVPKLTLVLRKAYGGAYIAMCSRSLGADQVFAWPTAEIAVMGAEGAANIVFKHEIEQAADPAAARQEKIEAYRAKFNTPYIAAARGYVDGVIEPQESRRYLLNALLALQTKREERPAKKHGNFPV